MPSGPSSSATIRRLMFRAQVNRRFTLTFCSCPGATRVGRSVRPCWTTPGPSVEIDTETLLRVDCWAGGNRELVSYYERAGFTTTDAFLQGDWPGQLLVQKLI